MTGRPRGRARFYHLLLFVPLLALWAPFYDRAEPSLAGIPFFYWFQMAQRRLAMGKPLDVVAIAVFVARFGLVATLGFFAAYWRPGAGRRNPDRGLYVTAVSRSGR